MAATKAQWAAKLCFLLLAEKKQLFYPVHLEINFQLIMCGYDAATTPAACTNHSVKKLDICAGFVVHLLGFF